MARKSSRRAFGVFFASGRRRAARSRRRGAAMLEFAIILPLLLLMIFGIIEFGRVIMLNQVTTNAAREGGRRAIIPGMTQARILDIVNSYLDDASISDTGRQVSILDADGNSVQIDQVLSHQPVTIEIQIPYDENTFGINFLVGSQTLVSRSTMRRE